MQAGCSTIAHSRSRPRTPCSRRRRRAFVFAREFPFCADRERTEMFCAIPLAGWRLVPRALWANPTACRAGSRRGKARQPSGKGVFVKIFFAGCSCLYGQCIVPCGTFKTCFSKGILKRGRGNVKPKIPDSACGGLPSESASLLVRYRAGWLLCFGACGGYASFFFADCSQPRGVGAELRSRRPTNAAQTQARTRS